MHEMTTTNCWGTFKIQHNYLFSATTKETKHLLASVVVLLSLNLMKFDMQHKVIYF